MKRVFCLILVIMLTLSCAGAESIFSGLFGKKAPNIEDARAAAQKAVEPLTAEVFKSGMGSSLEIRNTRVIWINSKPAAADQVSQKFAEDCFGNIKCVVEFFVFTDYYGNTGLYNEPLVFSVSTEKNGKMTCSLVSPFSKYRARTYSADYSGIVSAVFDLGEEMNGIYNR